MGRPLLLLAVITTKTTGLNCLQLGGGSSGRGSIDRFDRGDGSNGLLQGVSVCPGQCIILLTNTPGSGRHLRNWQQMPRRPSNCPGVPFDPPSTCRQDGRKQLHLPGEEEDKSHVYWRGYHLKKRAPRVKSSFLPASRRTNTNGSSCCRCNPSRQAHSIWSRRSRQHSGDEVKKKGKETLLNGRRTVSLEEGVF